MDHTRRTVIITASSAAEIIKTLFDVRKAKDPGFTLITVCETVGIKQPSHLSEMMSGKRKIQLEHADAFIKLFKMTNIEAAYFQLLVEKDRERDLAKMEEIKRRLDTLRQDLINALEVHPRSLAANAFLLEMHSAFAMLKGDVTSEMLVRYFTKRSKGMVEKGLKDLEEMQVIRPSGSGYKLTGGDIIFDLTKDKELLLTLMQSFLKDASEKMPDWISDTENAYFYSTIMDAETKKYLEHLASLKRVVSNTALDLETERGDMLFRLNVQMYPVR